VELLVRFLIGGAAVSAFALLADLLQPKRVAGLLSAAPSVAVASLALTLHQGKAEQVALEAAAMLVAACAFVGYAFTVERLLIRGDRPALRITLAALPLWFALAASGYLLLRRILP
jgi:hypothetical protein